jgi:uncharacterized cupredoxin-like copper-binding protein
MRIRKLGTPALSLAAVLVLAACSSQQPAPATPGPIEPTAPPASSGEGSSNGAPGEAVELAAKTLDTFVYEPNEWTTTAGAETTINLDNSAGAQEHTWVLLKPGIAKADAITLTEADSDKFLFSAKVAPGDKSSDTFDAPTEAGEYLVICNVPGHAAGGMTGTLTVQ